jgi:hypothetical protein
MATFGAEPARLVTMDSGLGILGSPFVAIRKERYRE